MRSSTNLFTYALALPLLSLASIGQAQFFGPSAEAIESAGRAVQNERNRQQVEENVKNGMFSSLEEGVNQRLNPPGIIIKFPVSVQGLDPAIEAIRYKCRSETKTAQGATAFSYGLSEYIPVNQQNGQATTVSITVHTSYPNETIIGNSTFYCEADHFRLVESDNNGMYDPFPSVSPLVDQQLSTLGISGDLKPDNPKFDTQAPSANAGLSSRPGFSKR